MLRAAAGHPVKWTHADTVKTLLTPLLQSMVEFPNDVKVECTMATRMILTEVSCADEDRKFLIGTRGEAADAVRAIFERISARVGLQFTLNITG